MKTLSYIEKPVKDISSYLRNFQNIQGWIGSVKLKEAIDKQR